MSATRRRGITNAFWAGATVSANATSNFVQMGRNVDQVVIYLSTSGASTFQIQVAHSGDPTNPDETIDPDFLTLNAATAWYDLYYLNGAPAAALFTFSGAGRQAMQVPDVVANWWRLTCVTGTSVVVTAGWEAVGE